MTDLRVVTVPATITGLVSKAEILDRLNLMLAECNHSERCEICLGVKIAIGAVNRVKEQE
jgi:hypothetical protein